MRTSVLLTLTLLSLTTDGLARKLEMPNTRTGYALDARGAEFRFDKMDGRGLPAPIVSPDAITWRCGGVPAANCNRNDGSNSYNNYFSPVPAWFSVGLFPLSLGAGVLVAQDDTPFKPGVPMPLVGCTISWGVWVAPRRWAYEPVIIGTTRGTNVVIENGRVQKPHGCASVSPISVNGGIYDVGGEDALLAYMPVDLPEVECGRPGYPGCRISPNGEGRQVDDAPTKFSYIGRGEIQTFGYVSACEGNSNSPFDKGCTVYVVRGGYSNMDGSIPPEPTYCTYDVPNQIDFGTQSKTSLVGLSMTDMIDIRCSRATAVSIGLVHNVIDDGPVRFNIELDGVSTLQTTVDVAANAVRSVSLGARITTSGTPDAGDYGGSIIVVINPS